MCNRGTKAVPELIENLPKFTAVNCKNNLSFTNLTTSDLCFKNFTTVNFNTVKPYSMDGTCNLHGFTVVKFTAVFFLN